MNAIEKLQRDAVLIEAKTWLNTPWRNASERKGAGVDCAQLVRRVFIDTGIVDDFPSGAPYSSQWALHRSEEKILSMVQSLAVEITTPKPADIVLWKFGHCFSHCGIVLENEEVIHSWVKNGCVTIDPMRAGNLSVLGNKPRPIKFFDVWARKHKDLLWDEQCLDYSP